MNEPFDTTPPGTITPNPSRAEGVPDVEAPSSVDNPPGTVPQPPVNREPSAPRTLPNLPGYEIDKEIGRGGMGIVYLARQVRANRRVAVKMMLAHASDDDRRRFTLEAQAIAEIDHPNIVKVYDVSEIEDRPYFAMEYCPGGSLSSVLDGTPWAARLAAELVTKLARGMEAAHAKGIIHRDLKPANVLLTSSEFGVRSSEWKAGESSRGGRSSAVTQKNSELRTPNSEFPKITDFGLAKRLDTDDGQTRTGAIMGTPSYMSPEQALGEVARIGPATDVYALGVLLYELLAGHPPFRGATVIDTLDLVRNTEAVSVRSLNPQTPKDLDTICIKCLRKDPRNRYPDAGALAEDLERWLAGRPIQARPVDWLERTLKWVNRNRGVAAGLAVGFAAVLIGVMVAIWQWREAVSSLEREREARRKADDLSRQNAKLFEEQKALALKERDARRQADEDALRAGQVTDFLSSMFKSADPLDVFGSNVLPANWEQEQRLTAQDFLDRAADRAKAGLKEVPLARAKLLATIGGSYRNLGLFAKADPLLEEAFQLRLKHLPPNHIDLARSHFDRGGFYHDLGDLGRAEAEFEAALKVQEAAGDTDEARLLTVFYIASCRGMAGHPSARKMLLDVAERSEKALGKHHRLTVIAKGALLAVMLDNGQEREPVFLRINLEFLEAIDAQPDDQLKILGQVAREFQAALVAQRTGETINFEPAQRALQQTARERMTAALRLAKMALPADHSFTSLVHFELGRLYEEQGEPREAEKYYRDTVAAIRRTSGFSHPRTFLVLDTYAELLGRDQRPEEARTLFREAEEANRRGYGSESLWRGFLLTLEATFEFRFGDRAAAMTLAKQVCELGDRGRLVATAHMIHYLYDLAELFPNVTGPDQEVGVRLLDHAQRLTLQVLGEGSWYTVGNLRLQAFILRRMGRWELAEKRIDQAKANAAKVPDLHPVQQMLLEMELGFMDYSFARTPSAEQHFTRAREIARKQYAAKHRYRREAAVNLMLPLMAQRRFADVLPFAIEAEKERGFSWTAARAQYRWERRIALLHLHADDPVPMRALVDRLEKALAATPNQENLALLAQALSLLPGDASVERWKAIFAAGPKERVTPLNAQIPGYAQALAGRGDFAQALQLRRDRFDASSLDEEILAREALARGDFEAARMHLEIAKAQARSLLPQEGQKVLWSVDDHFDALESELRRDGIELAIGRAEAGHDGFPERVARPEER